MIYFCLTPNIFNTFQECQHYEDTNFHKMKYDPKGHSMSYETTLMMKICMHAIIMESKFVHKIIYDLKCHFSVMLLGAFLL